MAWLRRRSDRFVLVDVLEPGPTPAQERADQRAALRRIAAEAVILQDEAESVMAGIRARQSLGHLAPRGGPVVRRFFALRDRLPARCADPDDERVRAVLDATFHHHAVALATALEFCALEWRSAALARQIDAMDGLGPPARRLEEVYAALTAS
jgi:hypothetical protein